MKKQALSKPELCQRMKANCAACGAGTAAAVRSLAPDASAVLLRSIFGSLFQEAYCRSAWGAFERTYGAAGRRFRKRVA